MSHELRPSRYPPLKRLTPGEIRRIDRLLGIPPEDPKDVKVRELRSQRRIARWKERQRMVPEEILLASDASQGEIDFLLGRSDIDPTPSHMITYEDLEPGDEVIVFVDFSGKVKKKKQIPQIPKTTSSDSKIDNFLFSIGVHISSSEKRTADIDASINKQAEFRSRTFSAEVMAFNASDATLSEFEFINDVRYPSGEKMQDPNPNHVIVYRKLVAKRNTEISAEPI